MSTSFDLPDVDFLTTGTVGPPGKRVFYLQARGADQVVTLRLEKGQVAALVRYVAAMLAELPPPGPLPTELDLIEPVVAEWVVGSLGVAYDEERDRFVIQATELDEEALAQEALAQEAPTEEAPPAEAPDPPAAEPPDAPAAEAPAAPAAEPPAAPPDAPPRLPADPPAPPGGTHDSSETSDSLGRDAELATAQLSATREQVAALAMHGAAVVEAGRPPCPLCGAPLDPEGHVCARLNGHRNRRP